MAILAVFTYNSSLQYSIKANFMILVLFLVYKLFPKTFLKVLIDMEYFNKFISELIDWNSRVWTRNNKVMIKLALIKYH